MLCVVLGLLSARQGKETTGPCLGKEEMNSSLPDSVRVNMENANESTKKLQELLVSEYRRGTRCQVRTQNLAAESWAKSSSTKRKKHKP